jgi:hypothetical protein
MGIDQRGPLLDRPGRNVHEMAAEAAERALCSQDAPDGPPGLLNSGLAGFRPAPCRGVRVRCASAPVLLRLAPVSSL